MLKIMNWNVSIIKGNGNLEYLYCVDWGIITAPISICEKAVLWIVFVCTQRGVHTSSVQTFSFGIFPCPTPPPTPRLHFLVDRNRSMSNSEPTWWAKWSCGIQYINTQWKSQDELSQFNEFSDLYVSTYTSTNTIIPVSLQCAPISRTART